MKKIVFCFILMGYFFAYTEAQQPVQLVPGIVNAQLSASQYQQPANHFRNNNVCSETTLSLPFFDDFSANNGWHPNCNNWQDNHAYINNSMAYLPPTLGVATLDGLNPLGEPYNPTAGPNSTNPADTLTSQLFDLSTNTPADDIVLSFFYQPQGLADRPEVNDSLIVEFRDSSNVWQQVAAFKGIEGNVSTNTLFNFSQAFLMVEQMIYLHDSFQFRFRNLASVCGNNDHWHIDYVYMDESRDTISPVYYADVAFRLPPVSPLKEYSAMPWRHFNQATDWVNEIEMHQFNHFSQSGTLDRSYKVVDVDNPVPELLNALIPSETYGPSPNTQDVYSGAFTGTFGSYSPTEAARLESTYIIRDPADFQANPIFAYSDTARRATYLDNYFAYDDGTAELRIIAQNIGTQVAVEFIAGVADTIRGVYIHMPYFKNRDNENDFVNIKVWVDSLSDSSEVFSRDIFRLRYVEGFNGFYYVELLDFLGEKKHVGLNAGQKFYVGWQQASTNSVPVGFDRSSDATHKTFVDVGGNSWDTISLGSQTGAIMIRPLLSPTDVYQILSTEKLPQIEQKEVSKVRLQLYPNPSSGLLNLQLEGIEDFEFYDYQIAVYNTVGQIAYNGQFKPQISLQNLETGLYFLTLRDKTGKLIAQRQFVKR